MRRRNAGHCQDFIAAESVGDARSDARAGAGLEQEHCRCRITNGRFRFSTKTSVLQQSESPGNVKASIEIESDCNILEMIWRYVDVLRIQHWSYRLF